MALKHVRDKAELYWTRLKRLMAALCLWGLVFSVVTIGRFGVAFDYDDTLVFSKPAYERAFASPVQRYSDAFWSIVNKSYDVERPQVVPYLLAWTFRLFGFRVAVITSRPAIDAGGLKKDWRHLIPPGRFLFAKDPGARLQLLRAGNYLLFFGDSDSDMEAARQAHVFPIRVRRSPQALSKEDYHPGTLGEVVIPYSDYSIAG